MQTVYIIKSAKDGNLYIGCTADLANRLRVHNAGLVRSTKARIPFKLVHKEEYADKHKAFHVERFYKTVKGKREVLEKIKHCGVV